MRFPRLVGFSLLVMIGIETEEPKFVFDIGLVFKLKLKYNLLSQDLVRNITDWLALQN